MGIDYGQGFWLGKLGREAKSIPKAVVLEIDQWQKSLEKIQLKNDEMGARDLMRQDEALTLHSTVKEVDALFLRNAHLQGAAVTRHEKPVGLVMRNK